MPRIYFSRQFLGGAFLFFAMSGLVFMALRSVPLAATESVVSSKKQGLVSHKALYEIQLAETKSGSQIVNIKGRMFYDWSVGCDAWLSNHRFNITYDYADSPPMAITSDFSIYEPFDGESLSFTARRRRNGQLFEEIRGQANITPDQDGEVLYTMPENLTFPLPAGTLFPMGHSLSLLEQFRTGRKYYTATIFDGSDKDGPVEASAFIGKKVDDPLAAIDSSSDIDTALLDSPARQIRLAFFPLKDDSETADYEMEIVFHENGIISDMFIEYDDFSVRQKLVALEPIDNTCENTASQR